MSPERVPADADGPESGEEGEEEGQLQVEVEHTRGKADSKPSSTRRDAPNGERRQDDSRRTDGRRERDKVPHRHEGRRQRSRERDDGAAPKRGRHADAAERDRSHEQKRHRDDRATGQRSAGEATGGRSRHTHASDARPARDDRSRHADRAHDDRRADRHRSDDRRRPRDAEPSTHRSAPDQAQRHTDEGAPRASPSDRAQDTGNAEAPDARRRPTPDAGGAQAAEDADAPPTNGAAEAASAGPKSLEDVLKRRQELAEEAAKPKFMTRKEREAAALARRKQQVEAQQAQMQQARADMQGGASHRPNGVAAAGSAAARRDAAAATRQEEQERERERELIRRQYLGTPHQKRRITKASDKFKFNFEWDAKEDTYEARLHEGSLLFGRGVRAGVDYRAQREAAAQHEQSYLSRERSKRGQMTSAADVQADILRAQRASQVDDDPTAREKHWSEKARENMTARDWRIFREDHRMSFKNAGANAPLPYRAWDEMPLPQQLRDAIADLGYVQPSAIQMASMPHGLRQRDVIGLAETGSGKTAAFVLPMLVYILGQPPMTEAVAAEGPYALVMAPTRELAQQIEEETIKLAKYTPFKTCCIVGGASYEDQIGRLRRGAEVVVATPGRLLDCLRRSYAVLNQCNYVVLDEADRMIDLGFEPQVTDVLAAMPSATLKPAEEEAVLQSEQAYRTTYMFSATMPPAVERIAKRYLRRPVTVTVGSAGKATDSVTQRVEWTERKAKPAALLRVIDRFQRTQAEQEMTSQDDGFKCIVFVNNRENSEDVYNALARNGRYQVGLLHGGKSQEQREETIKGFRTGDFDIMIATDVAGRGIDVKDVGMVLNYDMPHTIENYTHRIGRTGRAGAHGTAVTFLTSADEKTFYDLKQLLDASKAPVPPQLANHEATKIKPGGFEGSRKDTTLFAT